MSWTAISWIVSPHGGPSKHARQCYDSLRQRIVMLGGDRAGVAGGNGDAGNPELATFTTGSGTATVLKDRAGAGLRPAYPDNHTLDYDSRRDRYIAMRAFWFGIARATAMHPAKPANEWIQGGLPYIASTDTWGTPLLTPGQYPVLVAPFPANQFPNHGFGSDDACNFGVYDEPTDSMLRFFADGAWGQTLQVIPLANDAVTPPAQTVYNLGSGYPSGNFLRGYMRDLHATACQPALDKVGRALYVITQSQARESPTDLGWGLIKVNLGTPTTPLKIPLPATFRAPSSATTGALDVLLCFDSIRRELIHPMLLGYGGEVLGTLTYGVDTGVWTHYPSTGPPWPMGNCFCFDPSKGVAVLTGGKTTTSNLRPGEPLPTPTHYFTFASDGTAPPPIAATIRVTAVTSPQDFAAGTVAGFYRFTGQPTGGSLVTVDTPHPGIRFADFTHIEVGEEATYTGVLRNLADTLNLGTVETVVTTVTGTPDPPDPPDPTDTTPPTVFITEPDDLEVVSGIVNISFDASDNSGTIARAEIRVNNVLLPNARWDTTTIPNGPGVTVRVDVWDPSNNTAFAVHTVTITNVVDPPPEPPPTDDEPHAIFLEHFLTPAGADRVGYVLWVNVPLEFQSFFARPGYVSAWPKATAEEIANVEAGREAEAVGSMTREGTDEEMKDRLIALWQAFEAKVLAFDDWILADTFWIGDADETWRHR